MFYCVFLTCLHSQPPLPEEDYPQEDYPAPDQPEAYDELLAARPPTLPKEFALSHVNRTSIPRANLDRSTPTGWNLNVEPNGTWVFTSEHSSEQVHPVESYQPPSSLNARYAGTKSDKVLSNSI